MKIVEVRAKSIVNRVCDTFFPMRYLPFRLTINLYRGCSHGCIYCYAWRTHRYLGLKPDDFYKVIYVKVNAPQLFKKEITRMSQRSRKSIIVIGNVTDTYQPIDVRYKLTRKILEICYEHEWPCFIETKSPLILRDNNIISKLAECGLIGVGVTITSHDDDFMRLMEPFVPKVKGLSTVYESRMFILKNLSDIGVETYLHITPYFPYITDACIDDIILDAAESGVKCVIAAPLELNNNIWRRIKTKLAGTRYSKLIPLYEELYLEKGIKMGSRITITSEYWYETERRVAELCGNNGLEYWAFTNPHLNTASLSGIYRFRYPIMLDFWNILQERGVLTLNDAIRIASNFPVDKRYIKSLVRFFNSGELFKGIPGVRLYTRNESVIYAINSLEEGSRIKP